MPGGFFILNSLRLRPCRIMRRAALFCSLCLAAAPLSAAGQVRSFKAADADSYGYRSAPHSAAPANRFPAAPRVASQHAIRPPSPTYTPPARGALYTARPNTARTYSYTAPRSYAAPRRTSSYAAALNGGGLPYRQFRYRDASGSLTEPLNKQNYAYNQPLFHPVKAAPRSRAYRPSAAPATKSRPWRSRAVKRRYYTAPAKTPRRAAAPVYPHYTY